MQLLLYFVYKSFLRMRKSTTFCLPFKNIENYNLEFNKSISWPTYFFACNHYVYPKICICTNRNIKSGLCNEWLINYSKRKNSTVTVKKKSCTKSVVFRYVQSVSETKTTQKRSDLLFNDFYFSSFNFYF